MENNDIGEKNRSKLTHKRSSDFYTRYSSVHIIFAHNSFTDVAFLLIPLSKHYYIFHASSKKLFRGRLTEDFFAYTQKKTTSNDRNSTNNNDLCVRSL
jgi:hypothetical protein